MLEYNLINKSLRKGGGILKKNLKELREEAKLTQKYVAEKTNVTETYISLLENGNRNPSDKMKKQLAKLYKVKVTDIFLASELTKR